MRIFSTIFTCATLIAGYAYASAWTQPENTGILILSASNYTSQSYYDNSGHIRSQSAYNKYDLSPYFEYGLRDGTTIGANLTLEAAYQNIPGHRSLDNYSLGDSEFFLRKRLWQKNGFILSAEPMVKLPSPESARATPKIGGTHPDLGMGLSGGYGFKAFDFNHFISLDSQYRYRLGAPKDQIKLTATVGIGITEGWQLMPQLFVTKRTGTPHTAAFTQSSGDDYDLTRAQLSAVYQVSKKLSLQFGGFKDVSGKNTGRGSGVLLSVWHSL